MLGQAWRLEEQYDNFIHRSAVLKSRTFAHSGNCRNAALDQGIGHIEADLYDSGHLRHQSGIVDVILGLAEPQQPGRSCVKLLYNLSWQIGEWVA